MPNQDEQTKLIARLEKADVPFEAREDGLFVRDPSQNGQFVMWMEKEPVVLGMSPHLMAVARKDKL